MKWIKKGLIFKPNGEYEWMSSHVSPLAAIEKKSCIRVFFSTRSKIDQDGNYVSYLTYIDLDKDNPQKILYLHDKPLLELGREGTFDEFGIMVAKPVVVKNQVYLYYMGWQRLASSRSPYQVCVGLAISDDEGDTFYKYSEGPIVGIDLYDPISIGNVYVIKESKIWYMYYTTYKRWECNGIKATPEYNIKLAVSDDGIHWEKENQVMIEENEKGGIATPCIFEYQEKYRMLFGYRLPFEEDGTSGKYKIGYAESDDLIHWKRQDEKAGLSASDSGWDSEMVCYPHVIKVKNKWLVFYCGNGYGAGGFGYAELDESED